jgi:hypothetical protein
MGAGSGSLLVGPDIDQEGVGYQYHEIWRQAPGPWVNSFNVPEGGEAYGESSQLPSTPTQTCMNASGLDQGDNSYTYVSHPSGCPNLLHPFVSLIQDRRLGSQQKSSRALWLPSPYQLQLLPSHSHTWINCIPVSLPRVRKVFRLVWRRRHGPDTPAASRKKSSRSISRPSRAKRIAKRPRVAAWYPTKGAYECIGQGLDV